MDSEIFSDWIKQLDKKFIAQISFIVDNCPSHPHVPGLIDLIFLPSNTATVTQPMNQGVIRTAVKKLKQQRIAKYHHTGCHGYARSIMVHTARHSLH